MRKVKLFWAAAAVALVAVLALALGPAAAAGPTAFLHIDAFAFHPYPLVVKPGEIVKVINHDGERQDPVPHTVTAFSGAFDTGVVWDTARVRAPSTRGVYDYYCAIHPFMKGRLRVSATQG